MAVIRIGPQTLAGWNELTASEQFVEIFRKRFAHTHGRGIDRLSAESLGLRLASEALTLQEKSRDASYAFTPYLERLVIKGRSKVPRVLSVPSIRDRLLLHQLKDYLHANVPHATERTLPNQYIRRLKATLTGLDPTTVSVVRADIASFYDSIPHDILFAQIRVVIPDPAVAHLLRKAVRTPTVPGGTHRPSKGWTRSRAGVPQGLAVSNALANIYLRPIDEELGRHSVLYLRYVDDILMIVQGTDTREAKELLATLLDARGLELNVEKGHSGPATRPFDYLGYRLAWPRVGVRKSTVERYLRGVASMVSDYHYRTVTSRFPRWQDNSTRREAFLAEINEKITGALSEVKRYGWLFYFSEITDLDLLHGMDNAIALMFNRLSDFPGGRPAGLKRLSRAYFEARHSPDGGYIHSYNRISTLKDKLDFLIHRGQVDPSQADRMTSEEVISDYLAYRARRLQLLELDVGRIS